jgi:hypothetical protein
MEPGFRVFCNSPGTFCPVTGFGSEAGNFCATTTADIKKLYRKMGHDNTDDSDGKDGKGAEPIDGAKPVDPRVARRRQDAIGRRLRQMYDEVVNENIPDDFMGFLEEADSKRPKDKGPDQGPMIDPSEPAPAGRAVKSDH